MPSITARYPELRGKRVVITGGASGIGLATVERFVAEGAQVAVLDRDPQSAQILGKWAQLEVLVTDVSDPAQVTQAFATVKELWGGLDILIANAGISVRQPFLDISPEQWQKVVSVNLSGIFYCSQAGARLMQTTKRGTILMTASTNGYRGHAYYADYNASKAGVILLMKTIAAELAPWLRVNAVCPGYVLTPMQRAEYTEEMLDAVNQSLPLKRHAEPWEVAALFAFLASDDAQYITGQCVTIDGGETI